MSAVQFSPALIDAIARAKQRLELVDGDHVAAFDRLGIGISGRAFCALFPDNDVAQSVVKAVMLGVEADRAQRTMLAKHARMYAEQDRRWSRTNPDQLHIDGIEPARQVPGTSVTHLQKLRIGLWVRSNGKCEDCGCSGDGIALDIHHVSYDHYGHEEMSEVLLLCRDCHERRHGRLVAV